ncbi:Rv1355c family protein [Dyadobacter flavalbus]|uniref:Rv1355c family protein n=1 Tax=Dyadobacter flavalbus TaxID=2579942 RepID=A0A5M8QRZ0_9BACT|nr:Rv1355c family protein [Dyadobacter flavalbus]KAA6438975.1 Rv1355c family protein [Dyadobacter flavalbus]
MASSLCKQDSAPVSHSYQPMFFRLTKVEDQERLNSLLAATEGIFYHDSVYEQLKELIKIRNPQSRLAENDYKEIIDFHLNNCSMEQYGTWVFYPWSKRLVHMLDYEEFLEVRTSRNIYKITPEEQQILIQKRIGIVGLSVGHAIALTLTTERCCGELRLADFDSLELSNLNRVRTGVHNLGLPKVVIAAREIMEIDPYLSVTCFTEGLTEDNLDSFFLHNGKIDLLVEECDGLDCKIFSRQKARQLGIPVLMDTNDRGMLDIERFDLEPGRALLHGLIEHLEPENLKTLTSAEKVALVVKILGDEQISERCRISMSEIGKSITAWPQLASSVMLGGAMVTDVSRRILLGQLHTSGRFYVDLDEIVKNQ